MCNLKGSAHIGIFQMFSKFLDKSVNRNIRTYANFQRIDQLVNHIQDDQCFISGQLSAIESNNKQLQHSIIKLKLELDKLYETDTTF